MSDGFQRVLSHIRSIANTEAEKGRLFERLMKSYFEQDPLYGDRNTRVQEHDGDAPGGGEDYLCHAQPPGRSSAFRRDPAGSGGRPAGERSHH